MVLVVVGSDPALTVLEALRGGIPAPRQEEQSAGGVGEQAGFLLLSAFLCFFPGQMEQRQLCKDEERDVWVPKALAVSRVHQPAEKPGQSPGINQECSDDSLQHPEEATASARGRGPGTLPTVGNICTAAGGHGDVPGIRPWKRTGAEPIWFPSAQLLPLHGPAQLLVASPNFCLLVTPPSSHCCLVFFIQVLGF